MTTKAGIFWISVLVSCILAYTVPESIEGFVISITPFIATGILLNLHDIYLEVHNETTK